MEQIQQYQLQSLINLFLVLLQLSLELTPCLRRLSDNEFIDTTFKVGTPSAIKLKDWVVIVCLQLG